MKKSVLVILICILMGSIPRANAQLTGNEKTEMLNAINNLRAGLAQHGVAPLTWSNSLASQAQEWANHLVEVGYLSHAQNSYGQNLFYAAYYYQYQRKSPQDVVDMWAEEAEHYNYQGNYCDYGKVCDHYTQLIWKNTTQVGCAVGSTTQGGMHKNYWVCFFNPPGNYYGVKPY